MVYVSVGVTVVDNAEPQANPRLPVVRVVLNVRTVLSGVMFSDGSSLPVV